MTLFRSRFEQTASRRCACGCGRMLRPYNGRRPLVCYQTWKIVDGRERGLAKILMLPGSTLAQRRAAARRVFEIALEIKRERDLGGATA